MVESVVSANARILRKRSDKDEYLMYLDGSGRPALTKLAGTVETESRIYSSKYLKDIAYIGYSPQDKLFGNIFLASPIADVRFLTYTAKFYLLVKDVQLLRRAGENLPEANKRSPFTTEIFIAEPVARQFNITEDQRMLLRAYPLSRPVEK